MEETQVGAEEIKMSSGYVLSDEILKHKINGSAFDHVYTHIASNSLNNLDILRLTFHPLFLDLKFLFFGGTIAVTQYLSVIPSQPLSEFRTIFLSLISS